MNDHVHLPPPSIWPATTAAGGTLIAFGLATSLYISVAGAAVLALGLIGWIRELRHA